MSDPFEKNIRTEKLQEEIFKKQCLNAAEHLAKEIRTDGTPLHSMISDMLNKDKIQPITNATNKHVDYAKYPAQYKKQFDTLTKCYERYSSSQRNEINKKFDGLSKYLKFNGGMACDKGDSDIWKFKLEITKT